jgi:hypothetical protein
VSRNKEDMQTINIERMKIADIKQDDTKKRGINTIKIQEMRK